MAIENLVRIIFSLFYATPQFGFGCRFGRQKEEYYNYIPINENAIIRILKDIRKMHLKKQKMSFIDIGCGIPVVPAIAKAFGFEESYGLEYSELLVQIADTFKRDERLGIQMLNGDLVSYCFKDFDVLYSYNPIQKTELMIKGLENITKTMKKGAVFYFVSAGVDYKKLFELGFEELKGANAIYKYVKQ